MAEKLHPSQNAVLVEQYVATLLPDAHGLEVKRVRDGVSTIVYCIRAAASTYYLRICPEADKNLAAEVAVHHKLTALGLNVPDVLHFEAHNPLLQRSVMLTSEIPGYPLASAQHSVQPGDQYSDRTEAILQKAGRDLAQINQLPVQGYGWVKSAPAATGDFIAEQATAASWLQSDFAPPLHMLVHSGAFTEQDVYHLLRLLNDVAEVSDSEPAVLAHGDFDLSHIYFQHETYTGIIDFGEIRGAPWLYDLGHFAIEHGDLLPHLLAGYQEIRTLDPQDREILRLIALLIAARRIGRRLLQGKQPHFPDLEFVIRELGGTRRRGTR